MYTSTRQYAVQRARAHLANRPVFLDTETTGLGAFAEIVEICILDQDGQPLLDSLVKPSRSIPQDVIRIHGITNEMVRSAPAWPEVWTRAQSILHDRPVGIYNADFDLRMIAQSSRIYGLNWGFTSLQPFCIMRLYSDFYGLRRWQSLDDATRQCRLSLHSQGAGLGRRHRASTDTHLARLLLIHMAGG